MLPQLNRLSLCIRLVRNVGPQVSVQGLQEFLLSILQAIAQLSQLRELSLKLSDCNGIIADLELFELILDQMEVYYRDSPQLTRLNLGSDTTQQKVNERILHKYPHVWRRLTEVDCFFTIQSGQFSMRPYYPVQTSVLANLRSLNVVITREPIQRALSALAQLELLEELTLKIYFCRLNTQPAATGDDEVVWLQLKRIRWLHLYMELITKRTDMQQLRLEHTFPRLDTLYVYKYDLCCIKSERLHVNGCKACHNETKSPELALRPKDRFCEYHCEQNWPLLARLASKIPRVLYWKSVEWKQIKGF